ncbi:MAG: M14 family zinc carboxypeptidase [Clostridia bacterium]
MFYYSDLIAEIDEFRRRNVEVGSIGNSELGQEIPYIFTGNKLGKKIIITGAIHAREHITALLTICLCKDLIKQQKSCGVYFIPMVNPDGVRLATEGKLFLDSLGIDKKKYVDKVLKINNSNDFSLWKANINGVDLNVNFDASWGSGKQNVFYARMSDYVGKAPNDQAETKALINFTKSVMPSAVIAYHCKGEEIYWNFKQSGGQLWRDYTFARRISRITGYSISDRRGSAGGYKDWCIDKLKIPSLTIEVGEDKHEHPFPYAEFKSIYEKNKKVVDETIAFVENRIDEKKQN